MGFMVADVHPDDLLALVFHMRRAADQSVEDFTTAEKRSFIRMWDPESETKKSLGPTLLGYLKRSLGGQG